MLIKVFGVRRRIREGKKRKKVGEKKKRRKGEKEDRRRGEERRKKSIPLITIGVSTDMCPYVMLSVIFHVPYNDVIQLKF